jgi:hypothetical protein
MVSIHRQLLFAFVVLSLIAGPTRSEGSWRTCLSRFTTSFKSENQKIAEQILAEHKPYDKLHFNLHPISERNSVSIFKGTDPLHPNSTFVLKVTPLFEAFNDYFTLRILRNAQGEIRSSIKVVDSVLLTPKKGNPVTLSTKVIQKNPYLEGRPLVEILVDPEVNTSRKLALRKRYTEWISEMHKELIARGFEVDRVRPDAMFFKNHEKLASETRDFLKSQPDMIRATKAWSGEFDAVVYDRNLYQNMDRISKGELRTLLSTHEDILILLKSDNIIVNDADEMTLFDPF